MDAQRKKETFGGQIWFSKHSKKEEDMKSVNTEKEIVIKIYRLTWEKMSRGFTRREKKKKKKKKHRVWREEESKNNELTRSAAFHRTYTSPSLRSPNLHLLT